MVKLASLSEEEMLISLFGTEGGQIPRRDQQALLTLIKGSIN